MCPLQTVELGQAATGTEPRRFPTPSLQFCVLRFFGSDVLSSLYGLSSTSFDRSYAPATPAKYARHSFGTTTQSTILVGISGG